MFMFSCFPAHDSCLNIRYSCVRIQLWLMGIFFFFTGFKLQRDEAGIVRPVTAPSRDPRKEGCSGLGKQPEKETKSVLIPFIGTSPKNTKHCASFHQNFHWAQSLHWADEKSLCGTRSPGTIISLSQKNIAFPFFWEEVTYIR